jgi:hypothetical protein
MNEKVPTSLKLQTAKYIANNYSLFKQQVSSSLPQELKDLIGKNKVRIILGSCGHIRFLRESDELNEEGKFLNETDQEIIGIFHCTVFFSDNPSVQYLIYKKSSYQEDGGGFFGGVSIVEKNLKRVSEEQDLCDCLKGTQRDQLIYNMTNILGNIQVIIGEKYFDLEATGFFIEVIKRIPTDICFLRPPRIPDENSSWCRVS